MGLFGRKPALPPWGYNPQGTPIVAQQPSMGGEMAQPGMPEPMMAGLPSFPQMAGPVAPEPAPRGGFTSRNGLGVDLVGGLADGVLALNGMRSVYGPAQDAQRQRQQEISDYQRKQADQYALWERQQEYERANPKPQEPNALERNRAYLNTVEPGLGDTYSRNFASNGGGVPQLMNVPGVGVVSIPKTGAPQAPAGPPAAAIDYLKKNPAMAAQFDQKYGPGASGRYLGGAPSQGGATFR